MNGQRQPHESLFVQSVLQTLDVPPYNPNIYTDAADAKLSSNVSRIKRTQITALIQVASLEHREITRTRKNTR
jgi:hypothetical protein